MPSAQPAELGRRPLVRWPRLGRTLLRTGALAAAVAGAVTFVILPLQGRFAGDFEDFRAYYDAGAALNSGASPYGEFVHQAPNVALSGFDYPPLIAWLCRPLALLPYHSAATLWLWIGLAAMLVGSLVVARTLLPASWPRTELAVLATVVFSPAAYNLWHGQMNPLVFLLLALGLRGWMNGREVECGVCLGFAAGIKLAPAVLVLLLLPRRWWRGAGAALATAAATMLAGLVVVGWQAMSTWVTDVLPVLARGNGWLYNQSWNGVVNRAADHGVLTVEPALPALRVVSVLLSMAGVAAAVWVVRPGRAAAARRGAEFGAGVIAMLLAGTITWYAHYVAVLIPLLAGVALWLGLPPSRRRLLGAATLVAALSFAALAPLLIAWSDMAGIVRASHGSGWWLLLQVCSVPALSAAMLLAALVITLRRSEALAA
jgi:hypothetical protein